MYKVLTVRANSPTLDGVFSSFQRQNMWKVRVSAHCTEVGFASFLCSGFTAVAVINPPEKLQTIYVLKKKILLFLGLKFTIIESGFKSRADNREGR